MKYYQEPFLRKLREARGHLLAPHPQGETGRFALAFVACEDAFRDFPIEDLDTQEGVWAARLIELSGIQVESRDLFILAEQLSLEQKSEFSRLLCDLVCRCCRQH